MPLQPQVTGARHMIVSGHWLATQAGHAILEAGGNAVDAAVAAGIALGVLHSDQVNVAGVAPMIVYLADRDEAVTIAGLGAWPRAARLETFTGEHGGTIPLGLLRTVVPAAPDAWILALERYGTIGFGDAAAAAIRYAREGFTMHPVMAEYIRRNEDTYRRWPQNAAIYLPRGRPPQEGELFVQADLAASLQHMADEERAAARHGRAAGLAAARAAFYRGDLAQKMIRYHRDNGGLLTAEDLAGHRAEIEAPLRYTFRGIEVLSCGPWCQGPVLLQMLALLEADDLAALGHNTPAYVHRVAEAMKLCFADRDRYYGDPRFVPVPIETLLSPAYAAMRRGLIRDDRAFPGMPPPGDVAGGARRADLPRPSAAPATLPGDTSYVCAVDRHGNVCSATPSDVSWDSPVIPGTGFVPSARGSQSWAVAGHAAALAAGQAPAPHAQPRARSRPRPVRDAVRRARRRPPAPGHAPGVPQSRRVRDADPGRGRGAALRHPQLPGQLRAAPVLSAPARRSSAVSARPPARRSPRSATRCEWLPELSLGTAGVCAIVADRARGILWGGADPRRAARAMGW